MRKKLWTPTVFIMLSVHFQLFFSLNAGSQTPAGLMVAGIDQIALIDREARLRPMLRDFHEEARDLFARQQLLEELVPEQLHDPDRIGA